MPQSPSLETSTSPRSKAWGKKPYALGCSNWRVGQSDVPVLLSGSHKCSSLVVGKPQRRPVPCVTQALSKALVDPLCPAMISGSRCRGGRRHAHLLTDTCADAPGSHLPESLWSECWPRTRNALAGVSQPTAQLRSSSKASVPGQGDLAPQRSDAI